VGRQTELAVLQQALEQARTGHGQVVAVIGEPGVGKTRLCYEFIHSHRTQGWLALGATSVSYGKATTYLPVIDLLNVYFQVEEGDDPRRIREKVTGKLLTLDEALRPTLPAFLSLLEVPVEDTAWEYLNALQRRQHILDAVKRLLLRESQAQPLILVFENLYWIDSETQALLDRLVESLPTARLLLLVNYRPEYQHSWGSKTSYVQLRLDPLLPENAMELLRDLLGEDVSLGALKQRLIAWTEGNPFFLEEIVQTLVETHALVGERGAYRLVTSLETLQVPATVQAVLAARIDRLPLEEKDLLQTAAVIGKDVPGTLLQSIAELPEGMLHRGLAHLQAAEFLYETSLFPDIEYTFKHALTQQVAYGSLPYERRRVVHRRVGETLERLYPAQLEEYYAPLAYHYSRSDRQEKALEYLVKTGHKAAQRYANREALDAFQQALERVQMGEEYDRILGQCARLLLGLFRGKEAARDYERLLTSTRQHGNRAQELESLLGLASASYIISIDEPDFAAQSLELYKQAYRLARALDDKVGMVRSLVPRHNFLDYWPAYRDEVLANTEEALALSHEINDEELNIDSLMALYRCQRRIFGATAELEEQTEALLKRVESRHDLLRLKEHYFYLMQLHHQRGNFARCIEYCDAGIRLATEIGSLPVMYSTEKAFALVYLGRYDAAWAALQGEIADEAHPVGSMVKDLCTGKYFLDLMAYERASATLERAIDQTRRLHRWLFGRRAQLLLAKSLIRAGQLEPAHLRSRIQDLTSMSASLPLGGLMDIMAEEVMAELLLSEGTLDEALRQAETGASQADQRGFRPAAVSAREVQVRIVLCLNRPADAVALADGALRAAEVMHYLPMVWRLSAAKAQALTRLGNTAEAAQIFQAAAAVIRQLVETIPDAALTHGFLSNPLVSSIMAAAHKRTCSGKE
jgi:tetratricopeptide (TPR) repeat protein